MSKKDHTSRGPSVAELLQPGVSDEQGQLTTHSDTTSTKHSRPQESADDEPSKPKRRRRRVPVSCSICRHRKLKCDREHPCGSCKQLRLTQLCKYESRDTYFDGCTTNPAPKHDEPTTSASIVADSAMAGTSAAQAASSSSSPSLANTRYTQINGLYRPGLIVKAPIIAKYLHPGSSECMPSTSRVARDFYRGVVLTNFDQLSKFTKPEPKPRESRPLHETLETLENEQDSSRWNGILLHLPPAAVCDYLRKNFLNVFNKIFPAFTEQSLKRDFDTVRQHYLQYVFYMRRLDYQEAKNFTVTKTMVHRICLILMVLHLSKLSLGPEWSTKEIDGIDEEYYLGDGLRQIALKGVENTDIEFESSITLFQLIYYLVIYQNVMVYESDKFGKYNGSGLTYQLVECALTLGLHRDPVHYEHVDDEIKTMRRQLWRQVVFIDSLYALEVYRPPLINLKLSDVDLNCYQLDESQRTYEMFFKNWSDVARQVLENVLICPHGAVPTAVLEDLESKLRDNIPPSDNDDTKDATNLFSQILMQLLRLRFNKVCAMQNSHEVTRTALVVLKIESKMEKLTSPFQHVLFNLALKYGRDAWFHMITEMLDPENVEKCLPVSDVKTYGDVVTVMTESYQNLAAFADSSYFVWSHHLDMNSCLHYVKASVKAERQQGMNVGSPHPPADAKWADFTLKDLNRGEYVILNLS